MISKPDLDELEKDLVCLVPRPGVGGISSHEYSKRICDCTLQDLLRLARLGLEYEESKTRGSPYNNIRRFYDTEPTIPKRDDMIMAPRWLVGLGLWAKEHGVPALKEIDDARPRMRTEQEMKTPSRYAPDIASDALAALPREEAK